MIGLTDLSKSRGAITQSGSYGTEKQSTGQRKGGDTIRKSPNRLWYIKYVESIQDFFIKIVSSYNFFCKGLLFSKGIFHDITLHARYFCLHFFCLFIKFFGNCPYTFIKILI